MDTYSEAMDKARIKVKQCRGLNRGYIEIQSKSWGYSLVGRHKQREVVTIPDQGSLSDWAKAVVDKLVEMGLCEEEPSIEAEQAL